MILDIEVNGASSWSGGLLSARNGHTEAVTDDDRGRNMRIRIKSIPGAEGLIIYGNKNGLYGACRNTSAIYADPMPISAVYRDSSIYCYV